MKVVILYFIFICLSVSFLIAIDMISGLKFSDAIRVLKDSFSGTTIQERVIIYVFVPIPLLTALISFMKKRKQKN